MWHGALCCIPPDRARELNSRPPVGGHIHDYSHYDNPDRACSDACSHRQPHGRHRVRGGVCGTAGDGTPTVARAVSTRDLIELSKAGLGDEVLVALIEADGTVFNLDAPKILRAAGRRRQRARDHRDDQQWRSRGDSPPRGWRRTCSPRPRCAVSPSTRRSRTARPTSSSSARRPSPPPPPAPTYFLPWIPSWSGVQGRPARDRPADDAISRLRTLHQRRLGRQHAR